MAKKSWPELIEDIGPELTVPGLAHRDSLEQLGLREMFGTVRERFNENKARYLGRAALLFGGGLVTGAAVFSRHHH